MIRDTPTEGMAWLFFTDGEQLVFKIKEGGTELIMPDSDEDWIRVLEVQPTGGRKYTAWPMRRIAKVIVTFDAEET